MGKRKSKQIRELRCKACEKNIRGKDTLQTTYLMEKHLLRHIHSFKSEVVRLNKLLKERDIHV